MWAKSGHVIKHPANRVAAWIFFVLPAFSSTITYLSDRVFFPLLISKFQVNQNY